MTYQTIEIPYLSEKAQVTTYDNGYTFVFVPKKGSVFNVSTWVRTGSIHEDEQNNGVSHFLEHLMFKGTERFEPGEFDRAMESMGAIINAATWKDFTFYYITGPKDDTGQNFEKALDMHADMLLYSTLPEGEIGQPYNPDDPDYQGEKRERSVVIEEIGMRGDQPWTKVYNAANHMMYPDAHPYQRDVIGTPQIIGNIPREAILDYYHQWYSPQNLITIVVGDFEAKALEQQVLRAFDFSKNGHGKANAKAANGNGKPIASPQAGQYKEILGNYQTSFFIMAYHGPTPKQLEETIALDIASYVLGESRSSRLTQALLEQPKEPIFSVVSSSQLTFKLGNVFFIQGNFHLPDPKEALSQVQAVLDAFLGSEPITEEEFNRAVKKLKVDFAETSETAAGIAESIGESMTVVGDMSHYTAYLDTLKRVTLSQVNEMARRYLAKDKVFTSVLVPQ